MTDDAARIARNKETVRQFLAAVPDQDRAAMGATLAEDAAMHYQRPSLPNDSGAKPIPCLRGREAILDDLGTHIFQLFRRGTIRVTIESVIAEGDQVAVQWIMAAMTVRRNEPYENFYSFYFRLRDGKITDFWEYLDTLYASKLLFS